MCDNSKKIISDYLQDKADEIKLFSLYNTDLNEIINYLIKQDFVFKDNKLLKTLLKFPQDKKVIFDNIDFFINNSKDLLGLKDILNKVPNSNIYIAKINEIFNKNQERLIENITIQSTGLTLKNLKEEQLFDTIKIIVDELLKNENLKYCDIKNRGLGDYSNVILIGNKILKIGKKRNNFNIKHNKRFLKPIYRQEIESIKNSDTLLCIEITENVDTENVSFKDVVDIYNELRDQGLIWIDCSLNNIGRLIRDNRIYFNNNLCPDINATGYLTESIETLKKGEIVIIDNDYIYTEEEFQRLFNNDKSLEENIYSIEAIADLEYQYQFEKISGIGK